MCIKHIVRGVGAVLAVTGLFIGVMSLPVLAVGGSSSNSYQMTEMEFGGGSSLNSCSSSYCAHSSLNSVSGNGQSASYKTTDGSVGDDVPGLEVSITPGSSDLGALSSSQVSTKTSMLSIKSYVSDGYIVQLIGSAPKIDGHTLQSLSTPTTSQPGVEQFGINLVANTAPAIGTNPIWQPSNTSGLSTIQTGYDTANSFKYVSGDIIAQGGRSNDTITYTLSMIVNISNTTPAGRYATDLSLVVTPTY